MRRRLTPMEKSEIFEAFDRGETIAEIAAKHQHGRTLLTKLRKEWEALRSQSPQTSTAPPSSPPPPPPSSPQPQTQPADEGDEEGDGGGGEEDYRTERLNAEFERRTTSAAAARVAQVLASEAKLGVDEALSLGRLVQDTLGRYAKEIEASGLSPYDWLATTIRRGVLAGKWLIYAAANLGDAANPLIYWSEETWNLWYEDYRREALWNHAMGQLGMGMGMGKGKGYQDG